ncbi:MAG: hypothetical protein JWR26_3123 [Pedosphaera sp.]|nr:hypothetical protein [Pedosphaera sp.]
MSLAGNNQLLPGTGLFFPAQPISVSCKSSKVESASGIPADVALLTSRMTRHDESAYRQFYNLYFNRLLSYLLVVTAGREEASREALQSTMLRVVRHIRQFDSEEAFWGWLTVLARSSVVDAERKRTRYLALLERFFQMGSTVAAADPDAESRLLTLLESNLDKLPVEDRELLERKYFEGESVREIGTQLGATEKAVESRLVRVRRQLKELIFSELEREKRI